MRKRDHDLSPDVQKDRKDMPLPHSSWHGVIRHGCEYFFEERGRGGGIKQCGE
jgi:hypothetical protein